MLRDAAVSAVVNGMNVKFQRAGGSSFFKDSSDNDSVQFLMKYLQEPNVNLDRILDIIELSVVLPDEDKSVLARFARRFINYDCKDDKEKKVKIISQIVRLFIESDVSIYLDDILNIVDKHRGVKKIYRSASRSLLNINKNEALKIGEKLSSDDDPIVKFDIAVLNILHGAYRQSDIAVIKDMIALSAASRSFSMLFLGDDAENTQTLPEIISVLSKIDRREGLFWDLSSSLAENLRKNKYEFIYKLFDTFGRGMPQKPQVLLDSGGLSFELSYNSYKSFCLQIAQVFVKRSSGFSSIDPSDASVVEFFIPKSRRSDAGGDFSTSLNPADHLMMFAYSTEGMILDSDGVELGKNRYNDLIFIKTMSREIGLPLEVLWSDAIGTTRSAAVKSLKNIKSEDVRFGEVKIYH